MEKIIHYCWFGKKKKTKLIRKCICSWKRNASDFKLIEWNETNFSFSNVPQYVIDAYKARKFAFVSDYVRFCVLKKYGGIYLDTDVELLKNINSFEFPVPFFGMERSLEINPGLIMGLEKNDPICDYMIESYVHSKFYNDKYNITVCQRVLPFFEKKGFEKVDKNQRIGDYFIYSSEYFSPLDETTKKLAVTKNTISIHWFNASWLTIKEKLGRYGFVQKIIKFKNRIFRHSK